MLAALSASTSCGTLDTLKTKHACIYHECTRKSGKTEGGFARKSVAHGKRKAIKRKIKRARERLITVLLKIIPGYLPKVPISTEKLKSLF